MRKRILLIPTIILVSVVITVLVWPAGVQTAANANYISLSIGSNQLTDNRYLNDPYSGLNTSELSDWTIKYEKTWVNQHGKLCVQVGLYPSENSLMYKECYVEHFDENKKSLGFWLNPALHVGIFVPEDVTTEDLSAYINKYFTAYTIGVIDYSLTQVDSAHLISPYMKDKDTIEEATIKGKPDELIARIDAELSGFEITGDKTAVPKDGGVVAQSIDMGIADTNFPLGDGITPTYTLIDQYNPANDSGVIDTWKIYATATIAGAEVATMTNGGGSTFSSNDYVSIGAVASGSTQTFTGGAYDCDVTTGDLVGFTWDSGTLSYTTSGYTGMYYTTSDNIPASSVSFSGPLGSRGMAVYGTGSDAPAYSLLQSAFRFRNDDGDEDEATWYAAENVDVTAEADSNLRLRVQINSSGDSPSANYTLEFSYNSGAWTEVTTSSSYVALSLSSEFTDGTATTAQLTSPGGSFTAGEMKESTNAAEIDIGDSYYTEIEWCLQADSGNVSDTDTLDFRVIANGTELDTYSQTPTWTIGTPVTRNMTAFRWRGDDGDEDEASWLASESTNVSRNIETATRLRVQVATGGDPASSNYTLEWSQNGGSWTELGAGGEVWGGNMTALTSMDVATGDAACATDGSRYVWIIGGLQQSTSTTLDDNQMYDTVSDNWTILADMTTPRWGASGIYLDEEIYVFGGALSGGSTTNIVEAYSTANNTWRSCTSLPDYTDRSIICATDGTYIYIFYNDLAAGPPCPAYKFDHTGNGGAGSYTSLTSSAHSHGYGGCSYAEVDGEKRIYLLGGGENPGVSTDHCEYYRIDYDDYVAIDNAPDGRDGQVREQWSYGDWIFYGPGEDMTGPTWYDSIYVYSTANETWNSSPAFYCATPKDGVNGAVIGAKLYLFAGRSTVNNELDEAEVFDLSSFNPPIDYYGSTYISAGATDNTTAQLSVPGGKSFTAGRMSDDTNPVTIDVEENRYTEIEWCLQVTDAAIEDDYFDFRVTVAGTPLDTYTVTARLTYELVADLEISPSSRGFGTVYHSQTYWSNNTTLGYSPSWPLAPGDCYGYIQNTGTVSGVVSVNATNFLGGTALSLTDGSPGTTSVRMSLFKAGDSSTDNVTLSQTPRTFTTMSSGNVTYFEIRLEWCTGYENDPTEKTSTIYFTISAS